MQHAVWGTGYNAAKFMAGIDKNQISFFIDKDLSKTGKFFGKPILHPSEIATWDDLFIYVPHNFYDEIQSFLRHQGLHEGINFQKYDDKLLIEYEQSEKDLEYAIEKIRELADSWKGGTLFLCSHLLTKKSYKDYARVLMDIFQDLHLLTEAWWYDVGLLEAAFGTDMLVAPSIWDHYTMASDVPDDVGAGNQEEQAYLREVALQVRNIFPEADLATCRYKAVCIEKYIYALLRCLSPARIVCYDSVSPGHHMLRCICEKKNIPVIFTHPGIIPGTISFDTRGEMGESLPAVFSKQFSRLPVDREELEQTERIWTYLFESELNRKIQPTNDCISYIKERIKPGRPVIFFAGQNDVLSHMVPYMDITEKYHSPIFRSSLEAVVYLAAICKQNDWNLVYKPHPMYTQPEKRGSLPSNIIFVEFGDVNRIIDFSDVTLTILSSTCYNALIRYKPVVMLGYTQLRGKGCTYEAFEKDKIEDAIKAALEKGFTQEQQDAFLLHMAQCLKYYLYDDLQECPIRYGRPVPKSMDEFYELERLLRDGNV